MDFHIDLCVYLMGPDSLPVSSFTLRFMKLGAVTWKHTQGCTTVGMSVCLQTDMHRHANIFTSPLVIVPG